MTFFDRFAGPFMMTSSVPTLPKAGAAFISGPSRSMMLDPIQQCSLESIIVTESFRLNPLVLQDFVSFLKKLLIWRRTLLEIIFSLMLWGVFWVFHNVYWIFASFENVIRYRWFNAIDCNEREGWSELAKTGIRRKNHPKKNARRA